MLRVQCQGILAKVVEGAVLATTNTEVVQEIIHVLRRRKLSRQAHSLAAHILDIFDGMLYVGREDLVLANAMLVQNPKLPVRDAIHASTMVRAAIGTIVSTDRDFDTIQNIRRLTPEELLNTI